MERFKSEIRVTILVATKDRVDDISSCLKSLKICGYMNRSDIEIIVVDNNSSSQAIRLVCQEYSVNYLFEPKPGKSSALNHGIRNSNGTYIVFIDDDVVICAKDWTDNLLRNFYPSQKIGYVSGNVRAFKLDTVAERMWEAKGGLSKGSKRIKMDSIFLRRFRFAGVPLRLIGAGANCMIPKRVLDEIGYFDELLGPGSLVGGGESLDIVYRILRNGYDAIYDPEAIVLHKHPTSMSELRSKLYHYGLADAAIHTKFFLEFGDWRSLIEVVFSRNIQLLLRLAKSVVGKYPLRPSLMILAITGNLLGSFKYLKALVQMKLSSYEISRGIPK